MRVSLLSGDLLLRLPGLLLITWMEKGYPPPPGLPLHPEGKEDDDLTQRTPSSTTPSTRSTQLAAGFLGLVHQMLQQVLVRVAAHQTI